MNIFLVYVESLTVIRRWQIYNIIGCDICHTKGRLVKGPLHNNEIELIQINLKYRIFYE